jgi:hypothetical protein
VYRIEAAHNPEVAGSNPAPATGKAPENRGFSHSHSPYRTIVEKRLTLPDHEELRQHAANAIAKHSGRGWRIDKAKRSDNVDAIVALAMALNLVEYRPEPVELLG